MNDRFARYGAATGILFVVLVVIAFLVQPTPPDSDASPTEVLGYFNDHRDAVHVVLVIFAAAGFFFIWFIGTLRNALAAAEGAMGRLATTAYGAGLVSAAALIVAFGLLATAALHPAENGAEVTRALNDAGAMVLAMSAPAAAVFFVGNSLSILRTGLLPAWLAWLGLAAALFNALGIAAVFTDKGVFAPDGLLGFFVGFVLFLLWFLLASIMLTRRLGEDGAVARRPVPAGV
jgi:hypothetical protein